MSQKRSKWSSRKLLMVLASVLLATGLLVYKHIPPAVWESVFMLTVGGYLTAQAYVDGKKDQDVSDPR